MGKTLQDQFLKMGLVDKKKYNKTQKDKHVQKTKGKPQDNEIADMAKLALAEKRRRDQQLNKKKIAQRRVKEDAAKARQLIETHKIEIESGDITYNFKDENTIKKINLTQKGVDRLVHGKVGIVKLAGEYQLVPADTIYKVKELSPKFIVLHNNPQNKKEKNADDPYADYEIPDDLMW